jgi:hypothetical protein
MKTDMAFGRKWGLKHLAEGGKNRLKPGVVALLHLVNFAAQILVSGKHGADLEEGAHDRDIDVNGAIAVEYAGKHSDAVFGENARKITAATAAVIV